MVRRALLAALALCSAGCMGDGLLDCSGKVVDASGVPIAHASVRAVDLAKYNELNGVTANDGSFQVTEVVAPGRYSAELVVEAAGYKPVRFEIPTLSRNIASIKLAPVGSADDSVADVTAASDRKHL